MNKREKEILQAQLDSEKKVLKQLEKQYQAALDEINDKIRLLQSKTVYDSDGIGRNEQVPLNKLPQSRIYQIEHQKALKGQIQGILDKLHGDEYSTINQYLEESYRDAFVGTAYDLAGQGIPLIMPIDQNAAVKAIQTDSKISEGLYEALGVDTKNLKKAIANEATRGVASGLTFEDIARNISNVAKAPLSNAKRIARTEGHRIQQASTMDAQNEAKKKGADVVKQWDSTLDGATRETHRKLDGQIREVDEPFEADGKKAMYPGDFGDPAEDINCRCASLTRARWGLDESELETLKERAKFFGLDKTKDFEDFKNKYLKAAESVTKAEEAPANKFVPAKTIQEAETFASQFVDSGGFGAIGTSYSGVHLDVANAINNALSDVFGSFNIPKLGGIAAPAKNTKLGKMVNAHAAYSPIRKSILMDRNKTKKASMMLEGLMADKKAITNILNHPEQYDFSKLSARLRKVIDGSRETGRSIVAENITEAITHELGHHIEKNVSKDDWDTIKAGMEKYATKISGYSVDSPSEYFAESFTSYMRGENLIDPALREIFDKMRK